MATIYLARDHRSEAPRSIVALKVMRDEFVDDDHYVEMFLDEARILARLDHPNLIRLHEAGYEPLQADGQSSSERFRFLAMELLLGHTVAELWDLLAESGQRMPPEVAALIAYRVADGLHYAHELLDADGESAELVHRDVNPSNLFLTADGLVKVIDFGLARARAKDRRSGHASVGMVKGKITYLAPEQLKPRSADRRTDIFQLGITLWEMVTGKRLFLRDSQLASARAIQRGEIPAPESLVPGLSSELSAIVLRALAHDPDRRFTTMRAFARALGGWLRGRGVTLDPQGDDPSLRDLFERSFPGERDSLEAWFHEVSRFRPSHVPPSTVAPPAKVGGSAPRPGPLTLVDSQEQHGSLTPPPSTVTSVRPPPVAPSAPPVAPTRPPSTPPPARPASTPPSKPARLPSKPPSAPPPAITSSQAPPVQPLLSEPPPRFRRGPSARTVLLAAAVVTVVATVVGLAAR